ncbi:response regulator [Ramlibacter algicola]|uniref:histidine kinase n=1 Tax=Ramlibacter algicola TaxID=2795217 RepID=A0A934Q2F6_9BURK|nr:response regulator [Ramlibacter algicola]MBK0393362.1 response regulator [Ramlibacter algicola]
MQAIRRLFAGYVDYHRHGPLMLRYLSLAGLFFFPAYYLLRFTKADPGFDDWLLRIVDTAICAGLFLRDRWPERLRRYYYAYSYLVVIITLPYTFVFQSLKNGGGTVAVGNTLMATFIVLLLADWRNMIVMLATGFGAAVLTYIAFDPSPSMPVDYAVRWPILLGTVVGGSLFKFALERATAEKVRSAYASLAASIAHEMRNPLTQLKHSLEGVQQVLPPPGAFHHSMSSIGHAELDVLYRHVAHGELAIRRGLQAISMTLDEVHAKPPDSASFQFLSAAEVVHKAVDEFSLGSDEAHERVRVHVHDDFHFRGDETAFLYVLFNLMKNALYYATRFPDTRVDITVGEHEVKVRDTGPGIAPDVLQGLFEPFSSFGKAGGTGLGLAYCKRVMKAFGGSIHCESQLGSFTEFTMHFPPISEAEREVHRRQILEGAYAVLAGKRLLLVEDDAAQRVTTRHKLRPLGLVIDDAADGQRALEMLARHAYDLVLLDLHMPVLDGYQVVQRVRQGQVPANRYVRILAHTSEPPHVARVKTQRAGMDAFVSKPCAQLQLAMALQRALQRPVPRAASRPLEGRHLLLADDSAYNRRAVAAYLRDAGAEVTEVDHGVAVLERLEGETFDAVLMDLNMPGLDGLETTRAIRGSSAGWSRLPIVALTAHSDAPAIDAARAAGMDGFLVKPVDAPVLYDTLLGLLSLPRAAGEVTPALPPASPPEGEGPLLNESRLDSYRRLGLLDELLADYLPEIGRLLGVLDAAVEASELDRASEALHSLLGMSGEAGALALYTRVRAVYVPVLEQRRWPDDAAWLAELRALAGRTGDALRAYAAQSDPAGIAHRG